jgi:hypothetical protein
MSDLQPSCKEAAADNSLHRFVFVATYDLMALRSGNAEHTPF